MKIAYVVPGMWTLEDLQLETSLLAYIFSQGRIYQGHVVNAKVTRGYYE